VVFDELTDSLGGNDLTSISKILTDDYNEYLNRDDIDNGEDNYHIGNYQYYSKYAAQGFICPSPMNTDKQRKAFPNIFYANGYSFLSYLPGKTHSPDALNPYIIEFARSDDYFVTSEIIRPEIINDGGTMRALDPELDGWFVNKIEFAYTDGKLWMFFASWNFSPNPPVLGSDWIGGETYVCYSEDNGVTWSERIEIDSSEYTPSAKPIVVGNEIWYTGYGPHTYGMAAADLHSFLIKYNVITGVSSKVQLDIDWTDLGTSEPAILEYADDKYLCVARVNWNGNFPGAETSHKGMVIAYSSDGIDFSDYTFYDHDTSYPNEPKLFMYKDYVYLSWANYISCGPVALDESEIEWVIKTPGAPSWNAEYGWHFYQFLGTSTGYIYRYDPREGQEENERALLGSGQGSIDLCAVDETKDILLAALNFKNDTYYIGEPWVSIIKKSGVSDGPVYNERLIYLYEIPGDNYVSNTIKLWNDWIEAGDNIHVAFYNNNDRPDYNIETIIEDHQVTITSSENIINQKIIIEINK